MSDQNNSGFTILEVLIALLILSISLAVVSQAVALSVRNVARAAEYERVLMVVDQVRTENLPQHGHGSTLKGSSYGLDWTVETIEAPHPEFVTIVVSTGQPAVRFYRFLIAKPRADSKATS